MTGRANIEHKTEDIAASIELSVSYHTVNHKIPLKNQNVMEAREKNLSFYDPFCIIENNMQIQTQRNQQW